MFTLQTLPAEREDQRKDVIFEPEDFIARLAALVPKPRAHLTRYHGFFAPHSALREPPTADSAWPPAESTWLWSLATERIAFLSGRGRFSRR